MATLAKPLIGLLDGFWKARSRHSKGISALSALRLSDHDLADLNLPSSVRSQLEVERARDAGYRLGIYR